jgi:signal transduction histidine kinase/CheY-like chemotaxis protein
MWQLQLSSTADKAFFSEYVRESIEAILRSIILAFSLLYVLVLLFTMLRLPEAFNWPLLPTVLLILSTASGAFWLVRKNILLSQLVWQVGMALAILHTTGVFHRPEILFLMAFLPMIMVIALGVFPSLLSEIGILLLLSASSQIPGLPPIPSPYVLEVGAGGFLGAVLGWAFGSSLFTVAKWSLVSFREAQQNLEEVRRHRGHLARVMKDLDQAYHRLEQTNAALTNAWRKADEAERLKTEFVVNVSHELRTPLNLIIGFSEVISRSPESYRGASLPSAYRRDINAIYNSARHLLALIDDVLDLGRIDAGRILLVREEISPAVLTSEVVDMVREYIQAKGLSLQVSVQDGLPDLWIDALRIRQAMLNLLANAARFTTQGYIRLEVFRDGEETVFRIRDSGTGIAEPDLPHVFELFHSTNQPADEKWHSGTGVGLPLSKKFVEMHGGSMGVESVHGEGSAFWFRLPCARKADVRDGAASFSTAPLPGRPVPAPEHDVVVVDCDPAGLLLLQHHFEGFRFQSAPNLEEGISLAEQIQAVAIVADPPAGGFLPKSAVPIVHFPWPTRQQAAASLGAREILTKPVSSAQLLAAVNSLTGPTGRILIADADPELVRLFQRMLRAQFPVQNCLEAFNAEEVADRAREEKPDLVIMELSLLQSGGVGRIGNVSDYPALQGIPVILISEMNWEDLCLRMPGAIQVYRPDGFELAEVVQSANALFRVFGQGMHMEPGRSPAQAD